MSKRELVHCMSPPAHISSIPHAFWGQQAAIAPRAPPTPHTAICTCSRASVRAVWPYRLCNQNGMPLLAFARRVPPSAPSLRLFALTSLHSSFWSPQGHNAAYGHRGRPHNWESDSESEMSDYGSLPRFKRQVSEHGSECGAEQQPARPLHPPALPARTHAGRPRARAPATAIVLYKAP